MSSLSHSTPPVRQAQYTWALRGLAAYAICGGLVTLIGWFANIPRLTDWYNSGISMFANAALASVLGGLAVLAHSTNKKWSPIVGGVLGALLFLIGAGTLLEHLAGINLGIDTLIVQPKWGSRAAVAPGRIGPPGSLSFALLGLSFIFAAFQQTRRTVSALGIGVFAIVLLALLGYLYDADLLFSVARISGIAMQTATIVLALALGAIGCVPEVEPVRTLLEDSAAGLLVRRVIVIIIFVPTFLGWLRVWGQHAGYYDTGMGTAMLVLALITVLCVLLGWCASAIRRYERVLNEREQALEIISRLPAENPAPVMRLGDGRRVNFANPAGEAVLKHWGINLGDEAPPAISVEAREALSTGTARVVEHAFGDTTYSLTIAPVVNAGYVNIYFSDVTARKRAEEALQSADRKKDEFLAIVSHELRTPLTALLGWVKLLSTSKLPQEKVEHGLAVMERNIKLQAHLIEDLLDISSIVVGKMQLKPRRMDIEPVIRAAVESVRPALQAKEIDLSIGVESIWMNADPDRLQQVVWNLLSNAIKFTPKGGKVEVIGIREQGQLKITVRDNGRGIDPPFLPHIFNRFEQADSSTTRNTGGLGLGLAIVRHLVELHGGTIRAESPGPQKGSTFTIEIPLVAAPEASKVDATSGPSPSVSARPSLSGVRILVVDDDLDTCEFLEMILKRNGADTKTAVNVRDAMASVDGFCPHIVVSDIGMPGESGYDLAKKLRTLSDSNSIALIALTAFARSEDRQRALDAGFDFYISKPVEPDAFVATVLKAANGKPAAIKQ